MASDRYALRQSVGGEGEVVAAVERERVGTSGNQAEWAEGSHGTALPTLPSPARRPCR